MQTVQGNSVSMTDLSKDFRAAIENAGLTPPTRLIADGKLQRFPTNSRPHDLAGWYILHHDGIPAGAFGDWRAGIKQIWTGKPERHMTATERSAHKCRMAEIYRLRDEEERHGHQEAAVVAVNMWNRAKPAPANHSYLMRKGILPHGLRIDDENRLLLPVMLDGTLTSLQFIDADGGKKFLPGGKVRGGSFTIGELRDTDTLMLSEGFATGASLYEATGRPSVVAFSAGNLAPVAKQILRQCPSATIVVCGDNDLSGVGQRAAREAAEAVNGMLALPEEQGRDFNDVHVQFGVDTVSVAIEAALRAHHAGRCQPSIREDQVKKIGEEVGRYAVGNARGVTGNVHGLIKELADEILTTDHFARDAGGQIYVFKDGAYRPQGEQRIAQRVKALLLANGDAKKWSSHRVREVQEFVRVDLPLLWERPPADILNLYNGLLDLTSLTLRSHNPEHFSPVQLPMTYDPTATCPLWEGFVKRVLPDDCQTLPYELIAASMRGDVSDQKAVLLVGSGENGKSTLLDAIVAFLGRENVSNLALQRLEFDKFSVVRLQGKLANVCADLPTEHLTGTSTFKALTGSDRLTAERKFQGSFEFTPFARLLFSTNFYPQSKDSSQAFFRRWLVVPFDAVIEPHERILGLASRLAKPSELSGVLNKALSILPVMTSRGGFSQNGTTRAAMMEFREMTDPLAAWIEQQTTPTPHGITSKMDLHISYGAHAETKGRPPMSPKAFYAEVKRLRPGLTETQRRVHGEVRDVFLGIILKSLTGSSMSAMSADSAHSSQISLERTKAGEERVIDLTKRNGLNELTSLTVGGEPCFSCRSTRRWKSVHGNVVCAECHPPCSEELVAEWI